MGASDHPGDMADDISGIVYRLHKSKREILRAFATEAAAGVDEVTNRDLRGHVDLSAQNMKNHLDDLEAQQFVTVVGTEAQPDPLFDADVYQLTEQGAALAQAIEDYGDAPGPLTMVGRVDQLEATVDELREELEQREEYIDELEAGLDHAHERIDRLADGYQELISYVREQ